MNRENLFGAVVAVLMFAGGWLANAWLDPHDPYQVPECTGTEIVALSPDREHSICTDPELLVEDLGRGDR